MIKGKLSFKDGSVYDGSFREGLRHGKGKQTFPNGDEYTGEFKNDMLIGHGTRTYKTVESKRQITGSFFNGEPHGYC